MCKPTATPGTTDLIVRIMLHDKRVAGSHMLSNMELIRISEANNLVLNHEMSSNIGRSVDEDAGNAHVVVPDCAQRSRVKWRA